jgi:hypothetical protein
MLSIMLSMNGKSPTFNRASARAVIRRVNEGFFNRIVNTGFVGPRTKKASSSPLLHNLIFLGVLCVFAGVIEEIVAVGHVTDNFGQECRR